MARKRPRLAEFARSGNAESFLASEILRLQCLDGKETDRETAIHSQKSGEERIGLIAGTMGAVFAGISVERGPVSINDTDILVMKIGVARTGGDARRYIEKRNCTSPQIEANSYRYSTCERTAPSIPCTVDFVDSIT